MKRKLVSIFIVTTVFVSCITSCKKSESSAEDYEVTDTVEEIPIEEVEVSGDTMTVSQDTLETEKVDITTDN